MANVLIVDDDLALVGALRAVLEGDGHRISVAHDGAEGLQMLRTVGPIDAVLLDVEMPVLSGPEMAHAMMVQGLGDETIPIILFSANSDLPQIAADMGTPYWLAKPCDVDVLRAVLARAILERFAPKSP